MQTVGILVLVTALFTLPLTNPKEAHHFRDIKLAIKRQVVVDGDVPMIVAASLGLTDYLVENSCEYNNYLFFSTVSYEGQTVSIGLLGNVVIK